MATQGNTSRLAKMQMRYQQKQKEEMERKRHETTGLRTTITVPSLDLSENNKIQIGTGKVRQMFDERRQRVTGIDKSYPLQPISPRAPPTNSSRQNKSTMMSVKQQPQQSVNPNQRGTFNNSFKVSASSVDTKNFSYDTDSATITTRFNRNGASNKLYDNDYIENEQIPDMFSQLDDIDTIDSGRRIMNVEKQLASLNLLNNNNGSANIKLRPVITKKSLASNSSANSLNTLKKLPIQQPKIRSTPLTPERATFNEKSNSASAATSVKKPISGNSKSTSNSSSLRSSATSNDSAKQTRPMVSTPPAGMGACSICGRFFNSDRIEKHETICQKTATKKRKTYDATKHRVKGTEAEVYVKKSAHSTNRKQAPQQVTKKKADWRRKHEEFIQAIRSAKQVQQHLASGGKLSDLPPPPPSENPDYVQCPHCQRRFNESAAQRHIPKCANFQFNKPKSNVVAAAKKRF